MKKITFLFFLYFYCFLFFVLSPINAVENFGSDNFIKNNENLKEEYLNIKNNIKNNENSKISSINLNKKEKILLNLEKINTFEKKDLIPMGYNYSSLILNGDFEQGSIYWNGFYYNFYLNGWYDIDLISNGDLQMIDYQKMRSNVFRFPDNSSTFSVSFNYKIPALSDASCYYGNNGVDVYLLDANTSDYFLMNTYYPDTSTGSMDKFTYKTENLNFNSNSSLNRNLYLVFETYQEDPNCDYLFYLDNVSLTSANYVPDYTINTYAGSNGSITSGNTLAQGSSYTVNMTPNSGYEIADVLVDGVSVGPVKYYTFNNLTTNHSIQANFQTENIITPRVYRFFNKIDGDHFYTMNDTEMTGLININFNTWAYEGIAYKTFVSEAVNTTPLYRFWNKINGQHFYTTNSGEKDGLIANNSDIWTYEGIAYYVYSVDSISAPVTVYRFWNKINGQHFYTISSVERDGLIKNNSDTWVYEGIAWKVSN